ncbi:MAG: helix-turn-helix domain-containing protein [Chitinophagales bacterium]
MKAHQSLKKNIRIIRKWTDLNQEKFAEKIGIKRSRLGSYEEGRATPKPDILQKIAVIYGCSVDDLLYADLSQIQPISGNTPNSIQTDISGRRLQLRTLTISADEKGKEMIEWVPHKEAKAGYLSGYSDPDYISTLPKFHLPFLPSDASYRAFEIKGDSMQPLPSGSVVIGEFVQDWEHSIKTGKTYIIVSKNDGVVYKRAVNNISKDGTLFLYSDNAEYEPYMIHVNDVKEVWVAKRFIINEAIAMDSLWDKMFAQMAAMRQELKGLKN